MWLPHLQLLLLYPRKPIAIGVNDNTKSFADPTRLTEQLLPIHTTPRTFNSRQQHTLSAPDFDATPVSAGTSAPASATDVLQPPPPLHLLLLLRLLLPLPLPNTQSCCCI
jgi:hypothetical protein